MLRNPIALRELTVAGRSTQGVIMFATAEGERVVAVKRLSEEGDGNRS